jgi:predicted HTH transcriptional regulator
VHDQLEDIDPADLRGSGEDEHLEFKVSLRDPRLAARQLASLANSGGGRLVVGFDEERGPIGSMTRVASRGS